MSAIVHVAAPGREHAEFAEELDAAVLRVARSGCYVLGPEVDAFESEFASHLGVRHAVGVANGTDALELAFRALGADPGSEIITAANAGGYSAAAAVAIGARPEFVDVLPDPLLLDPLQVARRIGPRTRAVVVTHLFGHLHPGIEQLAALCAERSVPLVEDCAQSAGAQRAGRRAGTFGTLATHSFYPTKNLGAMGDAGMVTTDDDALADRIRALGQYGWTRSRSADIAGGRNSRLDEVQAAVLRVKLRHLDDLVARRRAVVERYRQASPDRWWAGEDGPAYSAHLAVTRCEDRAAFRSAAEAAGVATSVHFPRPDPAQPAFRAFHLSLPVTERACDEVVTLPCHANLEEWEILAVTDLLRSVA